MIGRLNTPVGNREKGIFIFYCLAIAGVVYITTSLGTNTQDVYWHLQMGEDIVKHGIFPVIDDYSFTANGDKLKSFPFIFQVIIFSLVDTFGYAVGTHLFLCSIFVLTIIATSCYLEKIKADLLLSCLVVTVIAALFHFRLLIRPEVGSYLFIVLAIICYKRSLESFEWKNLVVNCALMAMWTTYHNAIIGYIIFFGLYIDIAFRYIRNKAEIKSWWKWAASGLLLTASGYINPFFQHPLPVQLGFDPNWKTTINEYQNYFFSYADSYSGAGVFLLALISIAWSVKRKYLGYLFVVTLLIANSLLVQRLFAVTGIITVLFFADMVATTWRESKQAGNNGLWFGTLLIVFFVFFYTNFVRDFMKSEPSVSINPSGLTAYFLDQGYAGNVINHYNVGGFLVYSLYPEVRISIDGRTGILYDYDFFVEQKHWLQNEEALKQAAEKHDVNYLIVDNSLAYSRVAHDSGIFQLDYVDTYYSLYVRDQGNFPLSSYVYNRPYCWQDKLVSDIRKELDTSRELDGMTPYFIKFLDSVDQYVESESKTDYLSSLPKHLHSNATFRFMAYQAMKLQEYKLAQKYFISLVDYEVKDYLAAAFAYLMDEQYDFSEDAFNKAVLLGKQRYQDRADGILIYLLYQQLDEVIEFDEDYSSLINSLELYFKKNNIAIEDYMLDQPLFCENAGIE